MHSNRTKIEQILDRQKRMFRIAQDPTRYGLTLKMIAEDSGLGYDSVRNYAAGETQMPLCAIDALFEVLDDDLLSLLFRAGHRVITVPDGLDHDQIEEACRDYLRSKGEAHHHASPAQRDIAPCEKEALDSKAARLRAVVA